MTLETGKDLGAYRIVSLLGRGGMGEVYRAEDSRLERQVALKVLPAELAGDAERLARFEREAKLLASLNHPNVASIHGFEEAEGQRFLVLELVEGEDLAERLKRGPVPVDETLEIARQIAEALEAAHEKGIVHRDLKPANVKVTLDGQVKVLDFGLAKAWAGDPAASGSGASVELSQSPTLARTGTQAGVILGTAAYMSPEQARGKPADKRADIWAFGVVLFEMLTGTPLFTGETASDILAGVLKSEVDLGRLPVGMPHGVRPLLRRCLERHPKNRLHDIADARILLDEAITGAGETGAATPVASWRRALPWLAGTLVGLVVGVAGVSLRSRSAGQATELPIVKFAIPLPSDAPLQVEGFPGRSLAISRDGAQVVYAVGSDENARLFLRRLDATEIRAIPGTEMARAPFFSPDGAWLAYFDGVEGALKKIAVDGGKAVTLARGFANAGWMLGSWCDDGRIVFDTWNDGLRVIDGAGGTPRKLSQSSDAWLLDPQPLPGPGPCRVLFYAFRADGYAIEALSLDSGERTHILDNASHGRFLESGHLLFVRDDALYAAPFDPDRLKVTGAAVPLPLEAAPDWFNLGAPNPQLDVSRAGTLVLAPNAETGGQGSPLLSVTRDGQVEELGALPFLYPTVSLSPDGEWLAVTGRRAGKSRIEALDLRRKATTGLVELTHIDMLAQPVWALDGKSIYYARYGPFEGEIVRHALAGSAPDEVLARLPGTYFCPWSISPDGRWLVFTRYAPETAGDLLLLDLAAKPGTSAVRTLVAGPEDEIGAAISPDGAWIAYTSSLALIVDKFPEGGQKTRISATASAPVWSPDGRELYFLAPVGVRAADMMAAPVELTPTLRVGEPRRLFSGRFGSYSAMGRPFDVTRDGRRFLAVRPPPDGSLWGSGFAPQLLVVQNWFAELVRQPGLANH